MIRARRWGGGIGLAVLGWGVWTLAQAGPEATLPSFSRPEDVAAQNTVNRQTYDLANQALRTRVQWTTRLIGGATAAVSSQRAEAGAVVLTNGIGGVEVTGGVRFLEPFTTAPLVWVSHVGSSVGGNLGYPPENFVANRIAGAARITASSFTAVIDVPFGGVAILPNERVWVTWQAWGR